MSAVGKTAAVKVRASTKVKPCTCRICGHKGMAYASARPDQWAYDVCLDCVKRERAKAKAKAIRDREVGRGHQKPSLTCCTCALSLRPSAFAPYALAAEALGFRFRCRACDSAAYADRKAKEKAKAAKPNAHNDLV